MVLELLMREVLHCIKIFIMKRIFKFLFLFVLLSGATNIAMAQKGKKKKAPVANRKKTTRSTKNKTKTNVTGADATTDEAAKAAEAAKGELIIKDVKKSKRRDAAVDDDAIKDRTPLPYEHLRADDAVYRHKIWREIDTREKLNLPFRYAADENNGNQRFFSILMKAVQDSVVTVFNALDDRFTTEMSTSEVGAVVLGDEIEFPIYDDKGNQIGTKKQRNEINLDSIYKFWVKEEVVFDKESSRLFFRILGIAPIKRIVTPQGLDLGETPIFWVYYPDMRATFSKYEVYNGKNFGARMSWEELFESRMFYGRIIKSTIDNPYDQMIKNYKGLSENTILQLLEGETISTKIFNYEQDLWSY
jgi:gliding motility associated protien GldN